MVEDKDSKQSIGLNWSEVENVPRLVWFLFLCSLILGFVLKKGDDPLFEEAFREVLKNHPEGREKVIRTGVNIIEAANEVAA